MKHIIKGSPPPELKQWFEGQPIQGGRRLNCGYDDMSAGVKTSIKQRLLEEQGYLCCYTGMRIDEDRSHIEHFKPQALCGGNEDVDYDNLLAAFPGRGKHCEYGAHAKGDWYSPTRMVNPLHGSCEARFRFDQFGKVQAAPNDQGAEETIRRLRLDHDELTDLRRQAIKTALFHGRHILSDAQLRTVAATVCNRQPRTREFRPFCFAIAHAAHDLLHRRDRERKRRAYSRKWESK